MVGEHWGRGIPSTHFIHGISGGSGGDQLQPGVGDGGTPTEVVAEENMKILKTRKQENPPKNRW
jgi:hypothetical protein